MKILHISNGFADSKVHSNLTYALDELGVEQTVYCPVREERFLGRHQFEGKHIKFVYSHCIKNWYKYVYHYKRWMLYRDLKNKIDLSQFDVIQAPTLFSDGGLALKAFQRYGIPYIVAIRNTDINLYIRKLKHTYGIGRKILLNASKIVFISKGEMKEFEETSFVKPIFERIKHKILFQPNGIEDYWHNNISHDCRTGHDVLFIGDFTANKNVSRLAEAVLLLRNEEKLNDVRLILIGGEKTGNVWKNDEGLKQIIENNSKVINALGRIYDKNELASIMRKCALFAMPSIHETFGLVYIEALSQNLPVIYSKGQGIDGMFDDSIGIGVDALSVNDIKLAIRKILLNNGLFNNKNVDFNMFNWKRIAMKYVELYKQITTI